MSKIKAVIFDMDGLMFDTETLWQEAKRVVGKKLGYDIDRDMVNKTTGLNYNDMENAYKEKFGNDFPYDKFYMTCTEYIDESISNNGIKIKNGLIELLKYLKVNNYLIAIASSTGLEHIKWYLKCAGINEGLFNKIVSGEDFVEGKPNPEIFLKTCELLGSNPKETIVLEDSNNGIKAAYNAGCIPILIPDVAEVKEETRQMVEHEFNSLLDVISLLAYQ